MDETVTVMIATAGQPQPQAVVVPRRIGRVKLGDMLGEGTGGVVYAGYDEALGRRVAVKLLSQPLRNEADTRELGLIDGVRQAAAVKHPNVITVYDVDVVAGIPVVVMELIEGLSLRDLLRRAGRMDPSLAVFVMCEICGGVEALHAASIVHRDLKPANVLFDRDGKAHVCDFGLAMELGHSAGRPTAKIAGSPLYMAPEAYDGLVSPQSDVYALGVMLFELLCGQPPFSADTIDDMKRCHVAGDVPLEWLARQRVGDEMVDIVERCLRKQRILRYKTAAHLARAMEQAELPERREPVLRKRVAELVIAEPDAASLARQPAQPPDRVSSTFDVVADRARHKRQTRGE